LFPYSDADVTHESFPVVNVALIGLNVLVFLYELGLGGLGLLGGGGDLDVAAFFHRWGFIPFELTTGQVCTHLALGNDLCLDLRGALPESLINESRLFSTDGQIVLNIDTPLPTWATIFSSMFLHGGFFHLGGNMMFLWVFGDNLEDRLGHVKYLLFYLVAGVGAALAQLAVDPTSQTPLVGASGAISGVMGAYMLLFPFNRIKTLIVMFLITAIEIPAAWLLGLWFAWQLVQGLMSLGVSQSVDIAFFAHVGGFVSGVAIMAVYKLATGQPVLPRRVRQQPWDTWYRTRH
jgi:membrane associated rhomboid family serine protease